MMSVLITTFRIGCALTFVLVMTEHSASNGFGIRNKTIYASVRAVAFNIGERAFQAIRSFYYVYYGAALAACCYFIKPKSIDQYHLLRAIIPAFRDGI